MKLTKASIFNSPFLGVYSFCTDDYCLVPNTILSKEQKLFEEYTKAKMIKTHISQSTLIGVFLAGIKDRIVVCKDAIYSSEIEVIEKEGIKILLIDDYNAIGNLIAVNSHYGIASPMLDGKTVKDIGKFLNIEIEQRLVGGLEIPGSSIYVNDDLFIVNPNVSQKEFDYLRKMFKVKGIGTTLNYGDAFVGNDAVGNRNALLVGSATSNIELMKTDELIVEL